jgi:excisionase family DNA binding protein
MPLRSSRSTPGVSADESQLLQRTPDERAWSRDVRRQRSSRGLPKYYSIKAVAEALDVSPRTVRRWIANGDLIVTRVRGVVRIADNDLRAFLAVHREG